MKKHILFLLAMVLLVACSLSGCGNKAAESANTQADVNNQAEAGKKAIVCTTFPQYDWVKSLIAGKEDSFDLTLLMDTGADLHNYQPTAEDMVKIADCDLFIYVGGESDGWVEDTLKGAKEGALSLSLIDALGDKVKEEELVEGMQGEEEEQEGEAKEEPEEEEAEIDEHIWLSLKNAAVLTQAITSALTQLDSENAALYEANCQSYNLKLEDLDKQYTQLCQGDKTLIFGDRFPFRYLVDDYGLNYYAAFVGCSAETEASFETVAFLSQKLEQLNTGTVFVLENSDQKIAKAIINNTTAKNADISVLNSLQSINKADIEAGVTYLSVMEANLNTLNQAFNKGV